MSAIRIDRRTPWLLGIAICAAAACAGLRADEARDAERIQQQIDRAISEFQIFIGEGRSEQPLERADVLRWDNASRGSAVGLTVLYVSKGRPHAACCIYPMNNRLFCEFGAFSREKVRGEQQGVEFWNMQGPGAEFRGLANAPAPGKAKGERLLQMKKQAERFSLMLLGWKDDDSDRQELRLMPRPLYRYDVDGSGNVIDGAVFSYSVGVDPEALLILEAVGDASGTHWEYAFVRRTTGKLEGILDGTSVWEADRFPHMHELGSPFRGTTSLMTPVD